MMMYRSHRRDQQIINTPTLKRIVERYGWLNRHTDTRELNVNHQRIKHPINRLLVRHLREKRRTSYVDTYPQQISTRIHDNVRTKLKQIMHTDKKKQQTVHIYIQLAKKTILGLFFCLS